MQFEPINDIPDMTSDQVDTLSTEARDFDLHTLFTQVINLWRPRAERQNLQLLYEQLPEVPQLVQGDPARLQQILDSLLSNAIKFTKHGRISVAIDNLTGVDDDPCMLRIAVQDTGAGMSAGTRQQLRPLSATESGTLPSSNHGGGSGLATCMQLVNDMHGEIIVDSTEGIGTCFTVVLPFHRAQTTVTATGAPEASHTPASASPPTHHILVVDDNETNLTVCTSMLTKLGFRTTTAVNGAEAVASVQGAVFDAVLMDCHMPVLDGVDATRTIRAWETTRRRSAIPIIAVSASAFAEDRQRCADAGMNDFLPKPVTLDALRRMLDSWLGHAPHRTDTGAPSASSRPPPDGANAMPAELLLYSQLQDTQALCGAGFDAVLQTFAADAQRLLHTMQDALHQADRSELRRCAHKLKGSSAILGAQRLSRLCHHLEINAPHQQLDQSGQDVEAVRVCCTATLQALENFVRSQPGNSESPPGSGAGR